MKGAGRIVLNEPPTKPPRSSADSGISATPPPMAIAVMVSQADQDHIDAMYRRSIELAYARGHIRR